MHDHENIHEVASLAPDYMGFIYFEQSPRFVGSNFEMPQISKNIGRVGVFVNHPMDFVLREVERNSLEAVQLHGHETPEFCLSIKSKGITVIKAFHVNQDFDFTSTGAFQYKSDFFLFDTKGKGYGGNGLTFDWSLLDQYTAPTPFFLSGGLSDENIAQVATIKNPALYAVDINSGIEISPGIKSKDRLRQIIKLLKEFK